MEELTAAQIELLNKNPELKAVFEAKDSEITKLKEGGEDSEKIKALQAENKALLEKVGTGSTSIPINGTFTFGNKKYGFKDGAKNTRLSDGSLVPSEKLIQFANGEGTDKDVAEFPALKNVANGSKELKDIRNGCKDYINYLIKINYSLLEVKAEVKAKVKA